MDSYTLKGMIAIFGGILIHFTFGHFYTIANMVPYMMSYTIARVDPNVNQQLKVWLSGLALGIQGISMPIGGFLAKRFGFRIVVILSCLLESGGVLLTYFTIQKSFTLVMLTYSFLKGGGLGFGYSVVIAVAASWFPARRGLVVGMIVGGFGLGALIFTPIQTAFINPQNVKVDNVTRLFTDPDLLDRVPKVFLMLGGILLGLQIIGLFLLRPKPETKDNAPDEGKAAEKDSKVSPEGDKIVTRSHSREENLTPREVIRRIDFYLLWVIMFCNIIPITIITSVYKDFGNTFISDDLFLSTVATISSLFNSGGRIVWGSIVDRLSFKIPLGGMLLMWSAILLTFPHLTILSGVALKVAYALWVCLLFFSLSGVFAIMPAATGNLFGPVNLAVNYGLIFNAFAAGSLVCGLITTFVDAKDAYFVQFTGCGFVCIVAFLILIWITDKKINPRFNLCRWCASTCPGLRGRQEPGHQAMELDTVRA